MKRPFKNKIASNEKESSKVIITASITKLGSIIQKKIHFEDFTSRGYGIIENRKLTLNPYETLFLQSIGFIEVVKRQTKSVLDFHEILHHFKKNKENIWAKYLIYRDWRSRGYVVREGFGLSIDFRVYARGQYGKATASYLILGVYEGKPIPVKDLALILKHVQSLKKKLILTVVNRRGETVNYTLSKLIMKQEKENSFD